MTPEEFENLNKKHPYLTYVEFQEEDLIGIVQNVDNHLLSIYVYNFLPNEELKRNFLECGKLWWEDSNQLIPINIYLREDFHIFKSILRCFAKKDVKQTLGPVLSLENNFQKRIKRKRIQLIRDLDKT